MEETYFRFCDILMSSGLNLYFLLVVRSYHQSLAAGHDRKQYAADLYDTENTNIKRMPLE